CRRPYPPVSAPLSLHDALPDLRAPPPFPAFSPSLFSPPPLPLLSLLSPLGACVRRHDAVASPPPPVGEADADPAWAGPRDPVHRSEEPTSELQSRAKPVCRLLL